MTPSEILQANIEEFMAETSDKIDALHEQVTDQLHRLNREKWMTRDIKRLSIIRSLLSTASNIAAEPGAWNVQAEAGFLRDVADECEGYDDYKD